MFVSRSLAAMDSSEIFARRLAAVFHGVLVIVERLSEFFEFGGAFGDFLLDLRQSSPGRDDDRRLGRRRVQRGFGCKKLPGGIEREFLILGSRFSPPLPPPFRPMPVDIAL